MASRRVTAGLRSHLISIGRQDLVLLPLFFSLPIQRGRRAAQQQPGAIRNRRGRFADFMRRQVFGLERGASHPPHPQLAGTQWAPQWWPFNRDGTGRGMGPGAEEKRWYLRAGRQLAETVSQPALYHLSLSSFDHYALCST